MSTRQRFDWLVIGGAFLLSSVISIAAGSWALFWFLSLVMSLASNAAASLGMMPHPVTGETEVDLKTAKHWIDVLGMLEQKTSGNLDQQEAQTVESLLADLRMQYVSFAQSPTPPASKFSANDITGGK